MTDLARLGLEFHADGLSETNRGLDQLTQKAGAAERSTESLAAAQRRSGGATAQMLASIERVVRELLAVTRAQHEFTRGLAEGAAAAAREFAQLQTLGAATTQAAAANVRYTASYQPLKINIDATGAALGSFSAQVDRAAAATARAGQQAKMAAVHFDSLYDEFQNDFVGQYQRNMTQVGNVTQKATVNTRHMTQATLGLSRQFADIGVTAAMGMNPLMILIQQGPQIADQLALMRMQGIGVSAALRSMAASAAPLLIALAPLIALAAAAAGGFALLHRELKKEFPKDITKGMGLTEEQLDRVKTKTVTMGDTFQATLNVMGKYLMKGPLGDAMKWLSKEWNKLMDEITKAAVDALTSITAVFVGSYRWIVSNWRNLPAVFKDLFAMAVNFSIDALQNLLNAQTQVFRSMKDVLGFLIPALKPVLEQLNNVDLSGFKMNVSSAATFVGKSLVENIKQAKKDAESGVNQIFDDIDAEALRLRRAQALKEAGKPNKATGTDKEEIDAQTRALMAFADQMERAARAAADFERAFKANAANRIDLDLNQAILDADASDAVAEQMQFIADQARAMGDSIADGFGRGGVALATLMDAMTGFRAQESAILAQRSADYAAFAKARADFDAKADKTNDDRFEMMRAEMKWDRDRQRSQRDLQSAETRRNVAAIEGVKSLLSRKSAAYKVLTGLEIALQAVELAGNIKSMAMDAIATAKSIGNALARGAADAAAGAAKIFSMLGPFAFPVVAAMVALLAGLGLRLAGGGGGGGARAPTAEEVQARQGAGSVLGDVEAKSESLSRSLEIVAANTNRDLEYSNGMLRHLRSIDSQIGALTGLLARQLVSGGFLDASSIQGLGSKTSLNLGGILGGPIGKLVGGIPVIGGILKGLFGTTKTTTLRDLGIDFDAQSLDAILAGGLSGDAYQTLDVKTKKKLFGITTSNKTKTSTTETPLEQDILTEMTRIIESMRAGVLEAATMLGATGATAALEAFTVNLGSISFKDKTGEEIQAELEAVFSKLGDEMALTALPFLAELQKVGEGAFETLMRVARNYQVIDVTLASIGKTFGMIGVESLALRENLIDLFGSLDEFVEQTAFFAENFLTEAERMAPIQAAIVKEFERLGVTGVNTKDQFKQLVLGLDLTTQAGRDMYAALLAVAPAFAKVFEFLTNGSEEVREATSDLLKAYERQANEIQNTIDKFNGFAKSLREFRDSLSAGPNALLSPEAQYLANRATFQDVAARARLGDEEALSKLPATSQAFLDASRAYYASSGKYFQDLAAVKAAVQAAEETATRTAQNAESELDALNDMLDLTDGIRDGIVKLGDTTLVMRDGVFQTAANVLKVVDAIAALNAARTTEAAATPSPTPFSPLSPTGQPSYTYTPTTPANDAGAPGQDATWSGYLNRYADVMQFAQAAVAQGFTPAGWAGGALDDLEEAARYHWQTYGQAEGRTGFATGGSFTVGGFGGPDSQNFGPVNLSPGEIVDVRRPGDGANDNSAVIAELKAQTKALTEEIKALRAQVARGDQANAEATERSGQRVERALTRPSVADKKAGGRAR